MRLIILSVILFCSCLILFNSKSTITEKTFNLDYQYTPEVKQLVSHSEKIEKKQHVELKKCLENNKLCGKWKSYGKVLLTGYYEPELNGSFTKNEIFKYPLYTKPDDLLEISGFSQVKQKLYGRLQDKKIIPYYSRREIFAGSLDNKNLEILWVDDQIEAFLLQIQGSGRVKIGTENYFIGYSAKNGHPYRPIGKYLIEQGKLKRENVNLQTIEQYLRAHPNEINTILNSDPSFVFFRKAEQPATGSSGIVLPPLMSVASDPEFYPRGSLCIVEFKLPKEIDSKETTKTILVANLDTGGAIKGSDRMDLFTGFGKEARKLAGFLKQPAKVFCQF